MIRTMGWLHAVTRVTPKPRVNGGHEASASGSKISQQRGDRAQYRKLPELLRNLFCSIVAKHHPFELS
jgi:hypothetical protein